MSKLTYHRRMQLSFLLLIFLPVVAVSVISYALIKETMVEKVQLSNDNFMNVIIDEIARTIDDVSFASHFIVSDTNFRSHLKQFAGVERLNSYEDYKTFRQIEEGFSLISSKPLNNSIHMYLVNNKDFVISSGNEDLSILRRNKESLLAKVDMNQPESLQWLGVFKDQESGKGSYYIARVIHDAPNRQVLSVLLIGISTSYFDGLLKPVQFGKSAIFDAEGNQITNGVELSLEQPSSRDSGLRSEITLDKTNWTLVYEASKESLTGQISRTFFTGIIGIIILFIVFSMSSMVIAKRLYTPIQKLQRVVRQFGMGNLDMRLEVKGKDDIAELGHSLNTMLDQLQRLIYDIEQEQEQKKVMELEALFMQIRPHFLINTLNSIKCSLILQEDQLHSGVIDSLMSLLRAYLKVNEPTTLREECKLLRNYIEVMKIRNEIPLQLVVELEPGTEQLIIPKLMLQPLIENAVVHGLVDVPDACITVAARRNQQELIIEIIDNGIGVEEEQLEALNEVLKWEDTEKTSGYSRVGLINVVRRLRLTFGSSATMEIMNNPDGGAKVLIQIPASNQLIFLTEGARMS